MAHGKHSARLEEWLTELRVLILWTLRDGQPHGLNELKDWLDRSLSTMWGSKKLPKDLDDAYQRITTELDRLVSHRNCELSTDQGLWKIRLVQTIKTYQSAVNVLVSLEDLAGPYIRRCQRKGGWHAVAKLLPAKDVKYHWSAIAKRYANLVLQTIVHRLKAEGYQSRTTEAGEELYFGPGDTTAASASESTIPADTAGQDQDILKQDMIRPTVADSPTQQITTGTVTADGVMDNTASSALDCTQPPEQLAGADNGEILSAAMKVEKAHEPHDNVSAVTPGATLHRLGDESSANLVDTLDLEHLPPEPASESMSEEAEVDEIADESPIGVTELECTVGLTNEANSSDRKKSLQDRGSRGGPITLRPSVVSQGSYERRATMPNTFTNRLVVEGASSEVNRFVKRARGRHAVYLPTDRTTEVKSGKQNGDESNNEVLLSFNALYPVPPEVLSGGYAEMGERWQLEHWGCKLDNEPGKVIVRRLAPTKVEYVFETLGGPPLKWLERVSEDFPTLDFDLYFIAAWEVHGRRSYIRGELGQDWEEQPTPEDQARAGLLDADYCPTCGDLLSADGHRCPHCNLLNASGAKNSPEATTAAAGSPAATSPKRPSKPELASSNS